MREKYTTPEMMMVVFECADIVTTSNENETPFVPFGETWTTDVPPVN